MTKTVIVSLVSDQTIPNVLFIKEHPNADSYLFISTEKMETRGLVKNITNACSDQIKDFKTIVVEEDSLVDFEKILVSQLDAEDENLYLVNITGGTKIMSLGAYNYFTRIGNSEIYYLPLGKIHFRQIFPIKKNKTKEIKVRINLEEYLLANGVKVEKRPFAKKNNLIRNKEKNQEVLNGYLSDSATSIKGTVEYFRKKGLRNKNVEISETIKAEMAPFTAVGFNPENSDKLTKAETCYLTGDWFEEFTYGLVSETLGKKDEEIGKGVSVTRGEKTSNEFDVMFTHNNALYVIECKTDVADNEEGRLSQLFTSTLYKASTLKKDFGLYVKYYLFSINDFASLSPEQQDRARVLDIKLVGTEILSDENKLIEFIQKM